MPTTTTYGYKVPAVGENGSATGTGWAASLTYDINRLDAHRHDGNDSVVLSATAMNGVAQDIDNTIDASDVTLGWVLQSDGQYKRRITMSPASLTFDTHPFSVTKFTSNSGGEDLWDVVNLTVEKFAIGTYDLYIDRVSGEPVNASNILLKVVYVA